MLLSRSIVNQQQRGGGLHSRKILSMLLLRIVCVLLIWMAGDLDAHLSLGPPDSEMKIDPKFHAAPLENVRICGLGHSKIVSDKYARVFMNTFPEGVCQFVTIPMIITSQMKLQILLIKEDWEKFETKSLQTDAVFSIKEVDSFLNSMKHHKLRILFSIVLENNASLQKKYAQSVVTMIIQKGLHGVEFHWSSLSHKKTSKEAAQEINETLEALQEIKNLSPKGDWPKIHVRSFYEVIFKLFLE